MTDPNLVPFCDVFRPKFPPWISKFSLNQLNLQDGSWDKIPKTAAFGEIDGTFHPFHFIFVTTQHYRLPENNLSTGV